MGGVRVTCPPLISQPPRGGMVRRAGFFFFATAALRVRQTARFRHGRQFVASGWCFCTGPAKAVAWKVNRDRRALNSTDKRHKCFGAANNALPFYAGASGLQRNGRLRS